MSKDKNIHTHMGKGTMTKDLPIEIVERKGKGHPDSLTDKAAEELSVALCNYYVEHFGRVLHHNVDKAVLVGGQSTAAFGGGEITEPIYLMLVGRAVTKVKGKPDVPVGEFAVKGTKTWLEKEMPSLDVANDIVVDYRVKPGSVDLVGNYDVKTGDTTPLANDTSFGVGFAPYTDLEAIVKETEQMINGEKYKKKLPEVGQDVKIMGVRDNGKLRLTVAAAMISPKIKDKSHYVNVKEQLKNDVLDFAAKKTTLPVEAFVNTADNHDKGIFYLTVSGTSAEHGDDGQVGRGNRVNGMITPYRPMTLEAAAGKNPVTHVGKTYNVAANIIAKRVVEESPEIEQCYCYIVSQIGKPITHPKALNLEVFTEEPLNIVRDEIEAIAGEVMNELPHLWKGFVQRKYELW